MRSSERCQAPRASWPCTGTGAGERDDELATLDLLTDGDNVLRFDLAVGSGDDYQGNGIDPTFVNPVGDAAFVGLNGADRAGTADQTHYGPAFDASQVQDFEHFNASGLSKVLDYLAAGTNDPDGVGGKVSAGCIRMRNEDVEELYELLPVGSRVVVQP